MQIKLMSSFSIACLAFMLINGCGRESSPQTQTITAPPDTTKVPSTTTAFFPRLNTQTGLLPDPPVDRNDRGQPFKQPLVGALGELEKLPLARIALSNNGGYCTGILVGPRVVMTAAHCFWDSKKAQSEATDIQILSKAGKWVNVAFTSLYQRGDIEDWEFMDIAAIVLQQDLDPAINEPIAIGIRSQPNAYSSELKYKTELVSYGYTSRQWIKRETIKTTGAVAKANKWVLSTKYKTAYGGDSGGPVVKKIGTDWVLFGVLQGDKGTLYTYEKSLAFTWADPFIKYVYDLQQDSTKVKTVQIPDALLDKP